MTLASATVALIILIDLVTGQGPPALNSYLGPQPPREYLQQLPPPSPPQLQFQPIGYMPRGEFDRDSYGEKPKDSYEKESGKDKEKDPHHHHHDKAYEKEAKQSTTAPGILASVSNSMSDAWSKLNLKLDKPLF